MTTTDRDIDTQLRAWRRDLHRIPETAFEEHLTSTYVATALEEIGFDVALGIGGTGVVGSLSRGTSTRAVGLRADMDCLPLQEIDGREHGSTHPGRMHACGHDGHMAMVLGAASVLAADQDLDGTIRVIFQPAEEPGRGAQAMIDDGLFERFPIDALHGLHNLPGLPTGHLHTRAGGIMASEDNFEIVITGRGGHAARPEAVIDPLVTGAEIVLALQTVVARKSTPWYRPSSPAPAFTPTAHATPSPERSPSPATPAASTPPSRLCWSGVSGRSHTASLQLMAPPARSPTPTSSPPPSTTPYGPAWPLTPPWLRSARTA